MKIRKTHCGPHTISSRATCGPRVWDPDQGRNDGGKGSQFPERWITSGVAKRPTMSQILSSIQHICYWVFAQVCTAPMLSKLEKFLISLN